MIDFPIKGPANAKALPDVLPPLMPDPAKAQDRLGNVHYSRFMVRGDEKLLFLLDIDGEVDQHIERLVESAGPVFDAIFKHVDDPPATPVAGNPQGVGKWLKRHVREPLDTYFAYEDASVQDIKEAARAAGVTGKTSQAPLLTYMAFKSRVQGFVLKLVAKALLAEKSNAMSDSIGTLHFSHWVPFEKDHVGFLNLRRSVGAIHAGLRDANLVRFRCALSTYQGRAAAPSSKGRPGFQSVLGGKQLSGDRVLQRLSGPLGSRHSSPAGRSQVTRGHRSIAIASWSRARINPETRVGKENTARVEPPRERRDFFADCFVEGGTLVAG